MAVHALDAAMGFDREAKQAQREAQAQALSVGIVGFGNFGQFLAQRLRAAGHRVLATSRGDYAQKAEELGVEWVPDADDFCEEHPDVVLLCSSILSTEAVLRSLPMQRLKRRTLFVDVLSVKEFPKRLMLKLLPPEVDIMCTHPMFGPDSGAGSWEGLPFMYDEVRVGEDEKRQRVARTFIDFFRREGCDMVPMTCEAHDRQAASSQFITHTVGRMLGGMGLEKGPINTKGFNSLLDLVDNTQNDSFELYYGLFMYNQNATDELDKLEESFAEIKQQLFSRLHDAARSQLLLDDEGERRRGGRGGGRAGLEREPRAVSNPMSGARVR